jgi:hypothetical protein
MSKTKRGWLVAAAVLAIGASGIARADDSGGGGDAGDNGMNPMYGGSYATLEGQGHNVGAPRMQSEGAFAAHEMDNQQSTPMIERMKQAQQRMAEQTRHNWDAMVQKTHAMTEKLKMSMNTQGTAAAAETAAPSTATRAPTASSAPKGMTGSTSASSAAGTVVSSPAPDMGEPMVMKPAESATDSGLRIAPVNPRGQAPTIVGPSGG